VGNLPPVIWGGFRMGCLTNGERIRNSVSPSTSDWLSARRETGLGFFDYRRRAIVKTGRPSYALSSASVAGARIFDIATEKVKRDWGAWVLVDAHPNVYVLRARLFRRGEENDIDLIPGSALSCVSARSCCVPLNPLSAGRRLTER
jgi:hypothetical protein